MAKKNSFTRIAVYALLCIYLFGMVKPMLPLAKDILAHAFFKMEHLATVHLENGKFHVHAELQKENTQDNKGSNSAQANNDTLQSHISAEPIELTASVNISPLHRLQTANSVSRVCLEAFIPPPEA